jgi:hypothetical protein
MICVETIETIPGKSFYGFAREIIFKDGKAVMAVQSTGSYGIQRFDEIIIPAEHITRLSYQEVTNG